ncbi:MAG: sugar phosphate isomerase/epimerase, partial [Planctomycetales bacterium]
MKIGCGEWGFREMPMERHFEICRDFGFHWLEFGIGGGQVGRLPETPTDKDIETFVGFGQKFGIETPFCCLENDYTLTDSQAHDVMVQQTLAGIRAAKPCGATHIRLFAGFTPVDQMSDEIWARMINAFVRSDELCGELGMTISIETHGAIALDEAGNAIHSHTASTHPDYLRRLLEELPPRVGFNYDPGNLKPLAKGDSSVRLDLIISRINYCHMKDWR